VFSRKPRRRGLLTWQTSFFTLCLHPPLEALPGLLPATVVSRPGTRRRLPLSEPVAPTLPRMLS